jgi:MFS family permease
VPASVARNSLILLLTINLFNYLDRYILAAVEPEIRKAFFAHDDPSVAMAKTGSLASAFLVTYMLAAPLFGFLADRMSRWVLVGISVAVWSLASGASGLAGTFMVLLITRCFVGIGEAGYGPVAPALISELYPVERRGAKLAWFYMAMPVGSALGYGFGGVVSSHLGWRWPFYLVVIPGLILAAISMRRKETGGADGGRVQHAKPTMKDYAAILKIPSYLLATGGMTAMTFAIGGFSYFMPAYLAEARQVGSLAKVNTVFGAMLAVAGLTATLAGGLLGDYFRRYASGSYFLVSAAGIALSAVFIVLMVHAPFPLAWVWVFCALFFLFLNTGPANAVLANVTSPNVRATAFALNILIIHALGDVISPPILGAIAGKSWNLAMYVICGILVLASLLWLWGAAYLKRDTDRAEAPPPPAGGFPVMPASH